MAETPTYGGDLQDAYTEYVQSEQPITLVALGKKYQGKKRCSYANLVKLCTRDKWVSRRDEWQTAANERAEKLALTRAANARAKRIHRAQRIQDKAYASFIRQPIKDAKDAVDIFTKGARIEDEATGGRKADVEFNTQVNVALPDKFIDGLSRLRNDGDT